jgi:uncharacterized protein YndB with AHSA1/START domain
MNTPQPAVITAEPGRHDIAIAREFNAPPELVFRAFTDPSLFVQWMGPRRLTTSLDIFEPHSGGRWRYTSREPNGGEHAFHGVFHEVTAPVRIIQTFEYEGLPEAGHVALDTLTLEPLPGGRTLMKALSVFQTVADRDGMFQAGMESGMNESYARLDELLARVAV